MTTIRVSSDERDRAFAVLNAAEQPKAHENVWSRRCYAPMLIHAPEFANLRAQIAEQLPDYAIAFDVVFESRGNPVEWHCDYESLGPFVVPDRWAAVRDSHFMSVHFNLTEDGGALTTNSSVWLSYVCYLAIVCTGIFGFCHRMMLWLLSPDGASTRRSNRALEGNVFDNTRLHKVTGGAPRTSYVVRLVRKGAVVLISKQSIVDGIKRSQACMAFRSMLDCVDENASDAAEIDWARIPGVERERGASSVTGSLIWR